MLNMEKAKIVLLLPTQKCGGQSVIAQLFFSFCMQQRTNTTEKTTELKTDNSRDSLGAFAYLSEIDVSESYIAEQKQQEKKESPLNCWPMAKAWLFIKIRT